jgi:hypothetical protein
MLKLSKKAEETMRTASKPEHLFLHKCMARNKFGMESARLVEEKEEQRRFIVKKEEENAAWEDEEESKE